MPPSPSIACRAAVCPVCTLVRARGQLARVAHRCGGYRRARHPACRAGLSRGRGGAARGGGNRLCRASDAGPSAVLFLLLGLAFYVFTVRRFDLGRLLSGQGDHWVAGGALAISALAAGKATAAAGALGLFSQQRQILTTGTLVIWCLAMAWLFPLVSCEILRPRLRYDVRRWVTVFPARHVRRLQFRRRPGHRRYWDYWLCPSMDVDRVHRHPGRTRRTVASRPLRLAAAGHRGARRAPRPSVIPVRERLLVLSGPGGATVPVAVPRFLGLCGGEQRVAHPCPRRRPRQAALIRTAVTATVA